MPLDLTGPRVFRSTTLYARLPDRFYARVEPTHVAAPKIVRVNHDLAALLGLDTAALNAYMLAGNQLPAGAEPIAQAYSGHQFGHFSPTLGDGRAVLLGEVVGSDGRRYDIQLKGSGPTPFSRRGDGRAALGPGPRQEYLISEAMHALGHPDHARPGRGDHGRARVPRDPAARRRADPRRRQPYPRGHLPVLRLAGGRCGAAPLADYAIARHYPELAGDYRGFLDAVIARQADLVAAGCRSASSTA